MQPTIRGRSPVTGNAAAGLAGLLSSLGIADTSTRDSVEEAVMAELDRRGLRASIRELRWGVLTLATEAQTAHLLRFDADNVLAAVDRSHPGQVTRLQVVVGR